MMDILTRMAAAKKLSRYKLYLQNDMFRGSVIWCRTAYSKWDGMAPTAPNQHTFYELHYVLEGSLTVSWGARSPDGGSMDEQPPFAVGAGQFVLIPPRCLHQLTPNDMALEKLVCGFVLDSDKDFVRQALTHLPRHACAATDAMSTYVELMLENAMTGRAGSTTTIANLLECLLIEVLRQLSPDSLEKSGDRKVFENDLRIRELEATIASSIREPGGNTRLTGEAIAAQMNISLRHLNRLTVRYLGCSVGQYMAKVRLEYIKELLYVHELSLQDIAEKTGFQSEYALSRFFKNQEGMPIGVYRRSLEQ